MLTTVLSVIQVICCIAIIAVVMLQSGKSAGLSGSIGGGAETFFGKNKAGTLDGMFEKATAVVAVLFIVTSITLAILAK